MLKKLLIILILFNVNILFSKDIKLKPVIKYKTIQLQQKAVKRLSKDNTLKISKISKIDKNHRVLVSYDFGVNWIEELKGKGILIYPNPSFDGEVTVKINNTNSLFSNINLFDKEGNLIKYGKEFIKYNSLKITGLNKGIYYLNLGGEISPIIVE